jgi:hypothetical protein
MGSFQHFPSGIDTTQMPRFGRDVPIPHFPSGPVLFPTPLSTNPLFDLPAAISSDPYDIFDPLNRPPMPSPMDYSTPHGRLRTRSYRSPSALIGTENYLADSFRRAGYVRMAVKYERTDQVDKLFFLRSWLVINQHIPSIYLILGTEVFINPLDHSNPETSDDSDPQ